MNEILPYLLLFVVVLVAGHAADYFKKINILILNLQGEIFALQQRCAEVCSQQQYIIERVDQFLTQDPDRTGKLMGIIREIEEGRINE